MKLAAYLRVSTDAQVEKGLGPDIQRAAIRSWAKAGGHKISTWRVDAGVSGSNALDDRISLPEAIGDLRDRRVQGIVVYRLDRLARDLIVQETLLAEIRRLGGVTFSTFPSEEAFMIDDPEDPSRKLIRQVLGSVAEYERAMTTLRLRSGRRRKAENGGYAHGGPPFGKRAESRVLVDDPGEQGVLARIDQLCGSGASIRKIAATLNAEGLPAKRGGTWHPQTVARVLARRTPAES